MRYARRSEPLTTAPDRLPVELQDRLGFRFLSQLPAGPMRDSVEGYLAMPPEKRGPNSLALDIVVSAVRREQQRLRTARTAADRFFEMAAGGVRADGVAVGTSPEGESDRAAGETSESGPETEAGDEGHIDAKGATDAVEAPEDRDRVPVAESDPQGAGVVDAGTSTEDDAEGDRQAAGGVDAGASAEDDAAGERQAAGVVDAPAPPMGGPTRIRFEFGDGADAGTPAPVAHPARTTEGDVESGPASYGVDQARLELAASPPGWTTAFPELDAWGLRLVPGRLALVHGPPGGGRTAFLLELFRRYARVGDGAVFASIKESRAEVFARLLTREAAREGLLEATSVPPSAPVTRDWLRDPSAVTPEAGEVLSTAAARLDELVARGLLKLLDGPDATVSLSRWLAGVAEEAFAGEPRLVIVDDASDLGPRRVGDEAGSEEHLVRVARRLQRIADGRRTDESLPVVFSIPVPPPPRVLARVSAVLRVDDRPDGSGVRISVEKNPLGPRGGSTEIRVLRGTPDP